MESIFFDSQVTYDEYGTPVYDRPNSAAHLRKTFASLLSNGIVSTRHNSNMSPESGFAVSADGDMSVIVNRGVCWIEGACGSNSAYTTLNLDIGTDQPRIDIVVLRFDLRPEARHIELFVKKGTPSGDPLVPKLQRDLSVHELCIAEIFIPANTSIIEQKNIKDTRLDTDKCGLVVGLMQKIDTTKLYEQIQHDLWSFRQNEQADFVEWFNNLKYVLDDDVAGNLLLQINERVKKAELFNLIYPIGSIYMSVNSTNPGTLFGGTWVAWGSGRVPVGVNTTDNDFKTVEKTGGEKSVQLTGENLPKGKLYDIITWKNSYATGAFSQSTSNFDRTAGSGADFGGNNISMGGDVPHNNLQPYITCYMWKRTA